jgi:hypothetical protein
MFEGARRLTATKETSSSERFGFHRRQGSGAAIGASTMARIVKNPDLTGAILRQARKDLAER